LSLKLQVYASPATEVAIKRYIESRRDGLAAGFNSWTGWDGMPRLLDNIQHNDLLIPMLPRNGTLAFTPRQNDILREITESSRVSYSFIIIYVGGNTGLSGSTMTQDFDTQFLQEGVSRLSQKAGEALRGKFAGRTNN
ncbi:MAG: hypothetical protein CVU06_16685, partial [Bacteroidetes bacterium HGW-Bacteroidetes-22]